MDKLHLLQRDAASLYHLVLRGEMGSTFKFDTSCRFAPLEVPRAVGRRWRISALIRTLSKANAASKIAGTSGFAICFLVSITMPARVDPALRPQEYRLVLVPLRQFRHPKKAYRTW